MPQKQTLEFLWKGFAAANVIRLKKEMIKKISGEIAIRSCSASTRIDPILFPHNKPAGDVLLKGVCGIEVAAP